MMNHIGTVRIETDRLVLRPFDLTDVDDMFHNWASDDDVTQYLSWPSHKDPETTRGYIDYCVHGYPDASFYQWAMEVKETNAVIGNISVVKIIEEIDSLELGWVIGKEYWGKGYTAEAANALIEILFDQVGANCIYACHDVKNPNSGRVMQKVGMKYEGILRQSGRNNQGIVDCARYSILRTER